jgi:2'-5' RNA ligase
VAIGAARPRRQRGLIDEPRLFVAVPLEESLRQAVAAIVEPIRAAEPEHRGVRWVRLDGLHVTLRFLGPTSEDRIEELRDAIRTAASGGDPFRVTINGAGAFPPTGRPRTLFLEIRDGADELSGLARRLDEALVAAGWPHEDRPFRAHLTLARADGVRVGPATASALRAAAADVALESSVDRLVLYESITGEGRARYVERAAATIG